MTGVYNKTDYLISVFDCSACWYKMVNSDIVFLPLIINVGGKMVKAVGVVTERNDEGLWIFENGSKFLVGRENGLFRFKSLFTIKTRCFYICIIVFIFK